jgi:hypothetical protein
LGEPWPEDDSVPADSKDERPTIVLFRNRDRGPRLWTELADGVKLTEAADETLVVVPKFGEQRPEIAQVEEGQPWIVHVCSEHGLIDGNDTRLEPDLSLTHREPIFGCGAKVERIEVVPATECDGWRGKAERYLNQWRLCASDLHAAEDEASEAHAAKAMWLARAESVEAQRDQAIEALRDLADWCETQAEQSPALRYPAAAETYRKVARHARSLLHTHE